MIFYFRWLITPYRDNGHLTRQQKRFNRVLSSLRQKVERAIGLLKGRWRKLLYLDHLDLRLAVHLIISACVLHNFCIIHDDFYLMMATWMMMMMMMMMMALMTLMMMGLIQMEGQNRKEPI